MSRKVLILVAVLAALPVAALAGTDDEVVVATPSAAGTSAALAKAKTDPAAASSTSSSSTSTDTAPVRHVAVETDNGRSIHGSMGASIGTGGYRSAYMTALIPVGEDGTLGVAVSQTDPGNNAVYGYGRGGYGRWQRGGRSTSIAVSLDMSGSGSATAKDDTPQGCAPGFRDGGHYVEPVWVTKLHNDKACEDGETTSELTGQMTSQASRQP